MLALYKDSQKDFYEEISNAVLKNNKVSHAYFIETSSFADSYNLVLSFAKFLLCKNHYVDSENCGNCNICHLIDQNLEDHISIVEPDGLWIKKEQLETIKNNFSMKSVDGLPQIYIINQADKLNRASANSILKFLEEPEEGIIAILVAENKYQVLPTILSRCQIYTLKSGEKEERSYEQFSNLYQLLIDIEKNKEHSICYLKNLWYDYYKSKDEMLNAFKDMELIYLDLLNYKIKNITNYKEYLENIEFICKQNTVESIIRKINVIRSMQEAVNANLNASLLMDKFIIDYVGEV